MQLKIEHEELTRYVERLGPQMRWGTSLEWTVWQQFWELHHVHHKASPCWLSEAYWILLAYC